MALESKQRYTEITVTASGDHVLGNGGAYGAFAVEIDHAGDFSGTFEGRIEDSDGPWQTIAYRNLADQTNVAAAIVADALLIVMTQGLEVRLSATASAGSTVVRYRPVLSV